MTRRLSTLTMAAALAATVSFGAEVFSVNTVGAIKIPLIGGDTFNLISIPMHKLPVDFGTVSDNDATTITDAGASWTVNQYEDGVSGAEATGTSTFYVEITSGAHEGRHFYIDGNTATVLTALGGIATDVADDSLIGATYKIVPANRIRDIFGEPGGDVPLQGSVFPNGADQIVLWAGATYAQPVYYNGSTEWKQGAGNADDLVIDRDAGVFVNRIAATDTNLCVTGEVSGNDQAVVYAAGYNLVGGQNAVDLQITNTTLSATLQASVFPNGADQIVEWGGATYSQPVYYTGSEWKQGAANADGTELSTAEGYFVFIQSTPKVATFTTPLD